MGGGDQGSAQSSQQLAEEMRRQRSADLLRQGFQQAGAAIGTQMPYMQQQQGGYTPQGTGAAPPQAQALSALGQLFPQQGMGGGGGIDQQQLAMILQRLGYGG